MNVIGKLGFMDMVSYQIITDEINIKSFTPWRLKF